MDAAAEDLPGRRSVVSCGAPVRRLLLGSLLTGILLTGCGGGDNSSPPEERAAEVVIESYKAFNAADGERACSLLGGEMLADLGGHDDCVKQVSGREPGYLQRFYRPDEDPAAPFVVKIDRVERNGERFTVYLTFGEDPNENEDIAVEEIDGVMKVVEDV